MLLLPWKSWFLISCVQLASSVITLSRQLKYSTVSSCFWSIIMWSDRGLEILLTLAVSKFISIPQHLQTAISIELLHLICNFSPLFTYSICPLSKCSPLIHNCNVFFILITTKAYKITFISLLQGKKESGRYEYSKESKSKSNSSGGAAVVPVCLPLCCAMPCVIMWSQAKEYN